MFDPEPRFFAEVFAKRDLGLALFGKKVVSLCLDCGTKANAKRNNAVCVAETMHVSCGRLAEECCATYFPTCLFL